MTDTTHHVDCEKTTFFEAVLILSSFVYCAFTCEHEAQVQAHHGVLDERRDELQMTRHDSPR